MAATEPIRFKSWRPTIANWPTRVFVWLSLAVGLQLVEHLVSVSLLQ
jgi:hypothetical protein